MPLDEPIPYRFDIFWDEFPAFRYYSLLKDGEEKSLASQTLNRLADDPETADMIERFIQMMTQIGYRCKNIRANGMLRGEISGRALPPSNWALRHLDYLSELGHISEIPSLRWYCFDADNRILLLFGGGLKTTNDPVQCPNVRYWFRFGHHASTYLDNNKDAWAVNGLELHLTDETKPLWL